MKNPFDPADYPYCYKGHKYAEDVVAGKIPASKYTIGACKRYLREISNDYHPTYFFNADKAERYLKLVQRFHHVKGKWKTKNIVYEPWQCWAWMNIMGFIDRRTGFRRFRLAHIEVPRGNAKSAMASQAALYFAILDDPNGNEVSTIATKKDQARIVLDSARNMAKKNEAFTKKFGVVVREHDIRHPKSNSFVRAMSSDDKTLDGLNDVLAVMDELHAMSRKLFDVVYSGMSKRTDSLTLCITTAGFDTDSVGFSQSAYAKKVCLGEEENDAMFAVVYTIDEGDDIFDPSVWPKANPNWGVSVDAISFESKANEAKAKPADKPNFMVKHLNVWVSAESPYFDVLKWDDCYDPDLDIKDFQNERCRMALDLASKRDLASKVKLFYKDGKYCLFDTNYLPEERLKEIRNTLFDSAVSDGFLIATKGDTINNDQIREGVIEDANNFNVLECAYDPWNAVEMAQKLSSKVEMVEFRMTVANLSEAMKTFDKLIRDGMIRHNGSPLFRWCLSNVVAKEDANGNVYPRKPHDRLKIDPVVAAIMALALWIQDDHKESMYEHEDIRTV